MNIYLQRLLSISTSTKYTKWYCSIIENAISRVEALDYYEGHHILPKSFKMGGEIDPVNIVKLTSREHFICHRLLPKMLSSKSHQLKMVYALLYMAYGNGHESKHVPPARVVESIRKSVSSLKRGTKGKKWTDAQREKLKNRVPHNKGKPISEEAKQNLREKRALQVMGPMSADTKSKISQKLQGQKRGTWWNNGKKTSILSVCPGEGWVKGSLQKTVTGKKWWTDGAIEIRATESPGPNWHNGRLN